MGPGFISPDDVKELGNLNQELLASMGPGFISPDDPDGQHDGDRPMGRFNGAGLHQPG